MEFKCTNCEEEYEVTPEYAGMDFECTQCHETVSVPADFFSTTEPVEPPPAPVVPVSNKVAEKISNPGYNFGKCPKCHATLDQDAVICIECGHNVKLGVNSRTVAKAKKAGSFSLAVGIAAATALVSALIWAGIAIGINMEIGYIAWGIGFAVGGSVIAMTDERSVRLGVVAVLLAVGSIMLGKVIYATYGIEDAIIEQIKEVPGMLNVLVIAEMAEKRELDSKYTEWLEQSDLEYKDVLKPEKSTSFGKESKEMQTFIKEQTVKVKAKLKSLTPEDKEYYYTMAAEYEMRSISYYDRFIATSSLLDFLWFFLAISTAWKMATGNRD